MRLAACGEHESVGYNLPVRVSLPSCVSCGYAGVLLAGSSLPSVILWCGDLQARLSGCICCLFISDAWFKFSSWVLVEVLVRCEQDEVRTNVEIHTLVRESSITRQDILVSFDSGLIYQHVSESFKTRREQVKSVEDETNVPFTLSFSSCFVLSQRECKPGINVWLYFGYLVIQISDTTW